MPIYDNNNTNNVEIGKLYGNDGTANHQIAEVYDNNSSTNSLIYKDEYVVLGDGAEYSGGWHVPMRQSSYAWRGNATPTWTNNSPTSITMSFTTAYPNGNGGMNLKTVNKIDVTGYSTMYMTLSSVTNSNTSRLYCGLANSYTAPTAYGSTGWTGLGGNFHRIATQAVIETGTSPTATTYSKDISSLSGEYYVTLAGMASSGNENSNMSRYTISKIWFA